MRTDGPKLTKAVLNSPENQSRLRKITGDAVNRGGITKAGNGRAAYPVKLLGAIDILRVLAALPSRTSPSGACHAGLSRDAPDKPPSS